jgi:hypothetical protein
MISILLAVLAAADQPAQLKDKFDYAAKCRVHTQLLPALSKDPRQQETGAKVHAYWIKESDRLGKKLGRSKEELEIDYLLIEIKPDMDLIIDCAEKSKGVFKD